MEWKNYAISLLVVILVWIPLVLLIVGVGEAPTYSGTYATYPYRWLALFIPIVSIVCGAINAYFLERRLNQTLNLSAALQSGIIFGIVSGGVISLVFTWASIASIAMLGDSSFQFNFWNHIALNPLFYIIFLIASLVQIILFILGFYAFRLFFSSMKKLASQAESPSKKCKKCGREISKDAKFCEKCGIKTLDENLCSKCKTKNERDAKFCKKCGAKI